MDYENSGVLKYQEFLNFCKQSYKQNSAEYNQKLKGALHNVKTFCNRTQYRFFQQMSRDSVGKTQSLIRRERFIEKVRPMLGDNLNEINLLANHYTANSMNMIDFKKMSDDMTNLDDSETASSNAIIRKTISDQRRKTGKTLRELFEANSVRGLMDTLKLGGLMKECGFQNMDPSFVKSFITTYNKKIGDCLTYFQFVSAFDVGIQRQEVAMLLKSHIQLWTDAKKICLEKYNKSLNQKFEGCRNTQLLIQELEKLPGLNERPLIIKQFAALFSVDDKVDHFGIKLTEDLVGMEVAKYLPLEKPDTTDAALKVPGSTVTFKKLKGVRKFLEFLNSEAKEAHKSTCLDIFKKYDKKTTNKISHENFM